MQDRYERYRGFELAITHLPKCKIEVIATKLKFPQVIMYCHGIEETKKEIDKYWKEHRYAKDEARRAR